LGVRGEECIFIFGKEKRKIIGGNENNKMEWFYFL